MAIGRGARIDRAVQVKVGADAAPRHLAQQVGDGLRPEAVAGLLGGAEEHQLEALAAIDDAGHQTTPKASIASATFLKPPSAREMSVATEGFSAMIKALPMDFSGCVKRIGPIRGESL